MSWNKVYIVLHPCTRAVRCGKCCQSSNIAKVLARLGLLFDPLAKDVLCQFVTMRFWLRLWHHKWLATAARHSPRRASCWWGMTTVWVTDIPLLNPGLCRCALYPVVWILSSRGRGFRVTSWAFAMCTHGAVDGQLWIALGIPMNWAGVRVVEIII